MTFDANLIPVLKLGPQLLQKLRMNFGITKTLFATVLILVSMSSCLKLEKILDKKDGLCKPFRPYLKILQSPQMVDEIADEMQKFILLPRQKFYTNFDSLKLLVSGDVIFFNDLFSSEKDPGKIDDIAGGLVAAMIKYPTGYYTDALKIAIRKTKDLVVKDVTKQLKSLPTGTYPAYSSNSHTKPLIDKIKSLIQSKIWSKEIDKATAQNIEKYWDFEGKIDSEKDAIVNIWSKLVESQCLLKDPVYSMLQLLMYLIGSVERKPETLYNPLVKKEIEDIAQVRGLHVVQKNSSKSLKFTFSLWWAP